MKEWELILTKPVPEVVVFPPADWPEKYFSVQLVKPSSQVTLSLSYTKKFSSSIDLVAWCVVLGTEYSILILNTLSLT